MSLATLTSELFANTTSLLSELFASHKLRILLSGLRYLLIAPLLRVLKLPLPTFTIFPFNHPDPLFRDIESTVSELSCRMLMQVDAPLSVLIQTFRFQRLMVFLLEVPLHHAFVPAGGICQDSQLFVHRDLLLETIHTLFLHTLQHFVREVYFTAAKFF